MSRLVGAELSMYRVLKELLITNEHPTLAQMCEKLQYASHGGAHKVKRGLIEKGVVSVSRKVGQSIYITLDETPLQQTYSHILDIIDAIPIQSLRDELNMYMQFHSKILKKYD